jgi:predicted N-acyltransferase
MNCPSDKNKLLIPVKVPKLIPDCYELQIKGYSVGVVSDIRAITDVWDSLAPKDNIFLQSDYLSCLQENPANHMGFRYAVVFEGENPIAIVYMQTYWIRMEDSINKDKSEKPKNFLQRAGGSIRNFFVKKAVFNVLICGNLLLTGKHGYYFVPGTDENIAAEIVKQTFDLTQNLLEREQGKHFHIHMHKDYPCKEKDDAIAPVLKNASYHSFTIQPAMYMRLPESWKNFDDYLEEMQSKYRVRARRAAKKGEELQKKSLSLSEIEALNDEIYALYKGIANNVGFNAFTLHPNYFLGLKKYLGDKFQLIGLFLEGKLVAFFTCIFNGTELEAHFLGLDHDINREYQVYLNILYSIIDMAIYHRMKSINFARTALEIKSSVGAVPCELNIYLRHRNRLSGSVLKFVYEKLTPEEEWQPRSPFKDMDIVK